METVCNCCSAAFSALILGILLKKIFPEVSSVLCALAMTACFSAALGCISVVRDYVFTLAEKAELPSGTMETVFNVLSIGFITRVCSELCRNSGENSLGTAVDIAGGAAAVMSSLPLWVGISDLLLSFL